VISISPSAKIDVVIVRANFTYSRGEHHAESSSGRDLVRAFARRRVRAGGFVVLVDRR
jgi:hypothetical protein